MTGKNVLVMGMARSGIAAAKLLHDTGAQVTITDLKTADQLGGAMDALRLDGVSWRLGEKAEDLLQGMDALVISPGIPDTHPAVSRARAMGVEVLGEVELAYRLGHGKVVAVTGTNGKTTTTTLLGEIFKNAGRITFVVGNIGDPYSAYAEKTRSDSVVVCELSSFQLETVSTFHPAISAILNITEDHLNRHKTMENYIALKERVFENQEGNDCVVLNYDDPATRAMEKHVRARVVWFSRTKQPPYGAFVRDGVIVFGTGDPVKPICNADEVFIPGPHNLENALAATAVAMSAGIPAPVIRHTLKMFKGVEHRIETVRTLDGIKYINDSKGTNVDSTIKAVQTMKEPTVLIAGGSEKNADFTPLCEEILRSKINYVVLIGKTGERFGETLAKVGFDHWKYVGYDFEKAISAARAKAVPGGNVLLSPACASFDMFSDYEQRGREFKKIVGALTTAGDC